MKTPALLGMEGAFASVFPGTDFIVTHRHPVQVIGSVCALLLGVRELYYGPTAHEGVGEFLMGHFGEAVDRHLAWREGYPREKVLDLRIGEVVVNEFEGLRRIYDFLGQPLTDPARSRIRGWIEMDEERRGTPRKFTAEEFGLTPQRVTERFAGYIRRYEQFL